MYLEGSGCYGRNGHEDATADAALIATLTGAPVRVQWMRDDETARAPKSPPRTMDFEAALDEQGNVTAWSGDFWIALNHIVAFKPLDFPLLAATETGLPKPGNWVGFLFQNSGIGYALPNVKVNTRHVEQAFFRSAHLRSPGRIENSFANESFIDELAFAAKADPAEFRLRHLKDPRGVAVLKKALERAGWQTPRRHQPGRRQRRRRARPRRVLPALQQRDHLRRRGGRGGGEPPHRRDPRRARLRGARLRPDDQPGRHRQPGRRRRDPDREPHADGAGDLGPHQGAVAGTGRAIRSCATTRCRKVLVDLIDRPGEPSWGAGEPTACAIPAAIGNAVFDATGARLRTVPFTPDRVLAALKQPLAA